MHKRNKKITAVDIIHGINWESFSDWILENVTNSDWCLIRF